MASLRRRPDPEDAKLRMLIDRLAVRGTPALLGGSLIVASFCPDHEYKRQGGRGGYENRLTLHTDNTLNNALIVLGFVLLLVLSGNGCTLHLCCSLLTYLVTADSPFKAFELSERAKGPGVGVRRQIYRAHR